MQRERKLMIPDRESALNVIFKLRCVATSIS